MIASESVDMPEWDVRFPRVNMRTAGRKVFKLFAPVARPVQGFFGRLAALLHLDFFPVVRLWYRIAAAKVAMAAERTYNFIDEVLDLNPPTVANLADWGVCRLHEREILPGDLFKYRFELNSADAILPLEMGQELQMCVVDSRDSVLKEPFFPVSKPDARGFFDIVTRRGGDASGDRFAEALSQMGLGDEVAFKGGRYRLNYLGSNYPIEGMSIIASGFGAPPALQIIRDIFTQESTTIDDVEMLWVNEKKSDFVCDADLEALEYRYVERFTMSRIIQEDLYGRGLANRNDVKETLSPYVKGRLGVICAPEYVIGKARNILIDLGYPMDDIVTIVTSA
jgi:NAD(P)H-flavin reductase